MSIVSKMAETIAAYRRPYGFIFCEVGEYGPKNSFSGFFELTDRTFKTQAKYMLYDLDLKTRSYCFSICNVETNKPFLEVIVNHFVDGGEVRLQYEVVTTHPNNEHIEMELIRIVHLLFYEAIIWPMLQESSSGWNAQQPWEECFESRHKTYVEKKLGMTISEIVSIVRLLIPDE